MTERRLFNFVGSNACKLFGITCVEDLARVNEQIEAIRQLQKNTMEDVNQKTVNKISERLTARETSAQLLKQMLITRVYLLILRRHS